MDHVCNPLNPQREEILLRIQSDVSGKDKDKDNMNMDTNKDKDKDTSKDTNKDTEKDMNKDKDMDKEKDMDKDKDQDQDKNCILKVSDKNICRDYTATYKNTGSLKTHMVKIHLYKNIEFLCEICNNTFDTVQKLSRHKKSHMNI